MKSKRILFSLLAFIGPLFCLLSCGSSSSGVTLPSISSISLPEESEESTESGMKGVEAEEAKFKDFSLFYVPERGGYLVGDYRGYLSAFVIPKEATGDDGVTAPVIGLADYAFNGRKGITTVLLGENITYIGDYAFADTDITDLRIAGGLTHVGDHAFDGSQITFYQKDGEDYLPSWDDPFHIMMWGEDSSHVADESFRHVIIKPGITTIDKSTFRNHRSLITVTIPSTVTTIGEYAFQNCSSLNYIEIPASVTSIGADAFWGCSSLKSIDIPIGVAAIEDYTFYGCSSLATVTIPSSVSTIGFNAFHDCSSLEAITIPSSVSSIKMNAFYGCSSLETIDIPSSVTSIGREAFSCCPSLISISVDSDNPAYDSREGCNAIIDTKKNRLINGCKNTFIPSSVSSIEYGAFRGCSSLVSIDIPSSVKSIRDDAFAGCTSLVSFFVPSSVGFIGSCALWGCSSLTSIIVDPDNPYYDSREDCNAIIETETNMIVRGQGCSSIPSSVTSIGEYAFAGSYKLFSVSIPSSVTSIGHGAYIACASLASVFIPSSVISIGKWVFNSDDAVTIYCEAESQPEGWDPKWIDEGTQVVWGYKGESD